MRAQPLRAAVVGVGHFGRHHARIYSELPEVDLVAVVDIDSTRANEVASSTGSQPLRDYHDVLHSVDMVSVATPTDTHFAIARDFLTAGVSVLVEKPMTATLAQARELVAVADGSQAALQVGYVNRYTSLMGKMRGLHIRPGFIEVHRLSAFNFRSADQGVVLDMMIHDIDLILSLVKGEVVDVRAVGMNILGKTEDIANARITFDNGCVANLTASRLALKAMRKVRVFSPDSYVSLDFDKNHALVVKKAPGFSTGSLTPEKLKATPPDEFMDVLLKDLASVEEFTFEGEDEPLKRQLASFADCVRSHAEPEVSPKEALATMHVADRILKAIQEKDWREL